MSDTKKQGRPRKVSNKIRVQHRREAWRKASKKYYDKQKKLRKTKRKTKK